MALRSTQTSTVYPSIRFGESQDTLQPILVSVCFSGTLPKRLVQSNIIPIHISVSLSEEFSAFTTPVINEICELEEGSTMGTDSDSNSEGTRNATLLEDIQIPFLPLPSDFSPATSGHWMVLCSGIQRWLISIPQHLPYFTWGSELFWLAFIAANPDFPRGRWCIWDPRIMPVGPFIEGWLDGTLKHTILGEHGFEGGVEGDLDDVSHTMLLEWIWDEFSRQVVLFSPGALIA